MTTYSTLILDDLQIEVLHIGDEVLSLHGNQRMAQQFVQVLLRDTCK